MKAQDLKIGNYVFYNSDHKEFGFVSGVQEFLTNEGKIAINRRLDIFYDTKDIDPIPLTEEWLLKFGFVGKYKSVHTHWSYKGFGIGQKSDEDDYGASIPIEQVFYYEYKYDIKYVHQLQNLYFALTGEELTTKK